MKILRFTLAAAALTLSTAAAGAQATLPNFAGTWEINASKSNFGQFPLPAKYTMTIEQTAATIKATQVMAGPNGDFTTNLDYALDGKPTTGPGFGGSTATNTATLDATGLAVKTKIAMQQGEMNQTVKWTLSADGKMLTIDQGMTSQMGEMSFKIVLDKKP